MFGMFRGSVRAFVVVMAVGLMSACAGGVKEGDSCDDLSQYSCESGSKTVLQCREDEEGERTWTSAVTCGSSQECIVEGGGWSYTCQDEEQSAAR